RERTMGFDIPGKKPTTEEGKRFCNSLWQWRSLATYICQVAPQLASKCQYWQSNDGDGLDAGDALWLAAFLQQQIGKSQTLAYERIQAAEIARMPNEKCELCEGTGTRKPVPHVGVGDPKQDGIQCNACDGEGFVRPDIEHYPFSIENVREFVIFLRGYG